MIIKSTSKLIDKSQLQAVVQDLIGLIGVFVLAYHLCEIKTSRYSNRYIIQNFFISERFIKSSFSIKIREKKRNILVNYEKIVYDLDLDPGSIIRIRIKMKWILCTDKYYQIHFHLSLISS